MAKKEITDFGSKIGGARKDVWVKRGLCVEDIKDMTASEKEKYIKRDYIWPKPDIQEDIPARTILWKPRDCFWSKRTWRCSSTL